MHVMIVLVHAYHCQMVIVYDTTLKERISSITFEEERYLYNTSHFFVDCMFSYATCMYHPSVLACVHLRCSVDHLK